MLALLPMEFDGKHVTELQHDMYMHVNTVRKQIWTIAAESFSFKRPLDPVASGAFEHQHRSNNLAVSVVV